VVRWDFKEVELLRTGGISDKGYNIKNAEVRLICRRKIADLVIRNFVI